MRTTSSILTFGPADPPDGTGPATRNRSTTEDALSIELPRIKVFSAQLSGISVLGSKDCEKATLEKLSVLASTTIVLSKPDPDFQMPNDRTPLLSPEKSMVG